jgi:hypothetical protein
MNNSKKSQKRNKKSQRDMTVGPPSTALSYNGPLDNGRLREALDTHCFVLGFSGSITSSAGSVINTVIDPVAQATSSGNWTNLTGLFQEYRLLGIEVKFLPINPLAVATTQVPIFSVIDRQNNTALSTALAATSYASCKEHVLYKTFKRSARMADVGEAQWIDVTLTPASTNRFYIKLLGLSLAASTNYFQYITTLLVQFRGSV